MIELTQGNILKADVEALVNTVNCVGFMGKGIALQFKKAYPENFDAYHKACAAGKVQPGSMFIFDLHSMLNPKYIVNFPTKRDWRANSRYEDIESGLKALVAAVRRLGITSIAVPPLGCGLGGLDWNKVRPMIERAFAVATEKLNPDSPRNVPFYVTVAMLREESGAYSKAHQLLERAIALQEKLNGEDGEIEVPSVVEVEALYGHALEISNCILYTSLYDLTDDEDNAGDEEETAAPGDAEEEEGEYEAYAFLIDNIIVKGNGKASVN